MYKSPQEAVFFLVLLRVKFLDLATGEDEKVDGREHVDGGGDVVHYLPSDQKLESIQASLTIIDHFCLPPDHLITSQRRPDYQILREWNEDPSNASKPI